MWTDREVNDTGILANEEPSPMRSLADPGALFGLLGLDAMAGRTSNILCISGLRLMRSPALYFPVSS